MFNLHRPLPGLAELGHKLEAVEGERERFSIDEPLKKRLDLCQQLNANACCQWEDAMQECVTMPRAAGTCRAAGTRWTCEAARLKHRCKNSPGRLLVFPVLIKRLSRAVFSYFKKKKWAKRHLRFFFLCCSGQTEVHSGSFIYFVLSLSGFFYTMRTH